MPRRRMIGRDVTSLAKNTFGGQSMRCEYQDALYSGVVDKLRWYASGAGQNACFAVYNGDGTILYSADYIGSTTVVGENWADTVSLVNVVASTGYGLATETIPGGNVTYHGDGDYWNNGNTKWSVPFGGNYNSGLGLSLEAWGWIPPAIASVNSGSSIAITDTNITLVGTDIMDTQGTGKLELCNNATYASATVKVTQSIDSWDDTEIVFDVVQGGLSAGTVYAFATTSLGQLNSTGHAVTLTGGDVDKHNAILMSSNF